MTMKLIDKTFVKFVLVGVINTIVGTGTMFVMYNLFGLSYWLSTASNYIVGSVVSYFLNKYFTFKNSKKSIGQIIRFIINISVCYFAAYGAAKPLVRFIMADFTVKTQENTAMLVGMGIFVVLNYFGQKLFVFRSE